MTEAYTPEPHFTWSRFVAVFILGLRFFITYQQYYFSVHIKRLVRLFLVAVANV